MRSSRGFSDRDLERALRRERPKPPSELIAALKAEVGSRRPRATFVPRFATAAFVTAFLVVSLGVAGALGYASKSTESLGHGIVHTITSPFGKDNKGGGQDGARNGYGDGNNGDGDRYGRYPFHHQYGHNVPMCRDKRETVFVPASESVYLMLHGYRPGSCNPHRHHHH
jgi:hypothetical protein